MKFDVDAVMENSLHQFLQTKIFGHTAYTFNEIDSTNRFAKKMANNGAEEGTLVYAEKQSKGYGRHQRGWHSPAGKGLWFSIILKPQMKASTLSLLTLLGVTSTAIAIEQRIETKLQVKWPNDLILNQKKLAGILVETTLSGNKALYAVLGIGINVDQTVEDFLPDIQSTATSLKMAGWADVDRQALLSQILLQIEKDYMRSKVEGFSFVLSRWITRSSVLNKNISIQVNRQLRKGRVKGFHGNGDLILAFPEGREERISDGTIVEVGCDFGH